MIKVNWFDVQAPDSKVFICGYCGNKVASDKGWRDESNGYRIYICPECSNPTYFERYKQTPGVAYGNSVEGISDDETRLLYDEARNCCSVNSYTAVVLCCRKLLMHIAVAEGAEEGLSFKQYVNYLDDNHYLPPHAAESWVDEIRKKGNEANHEITLMGKEDAEELLKFIEMLLKFLYEYPSEIQNKIPSTP